MSRPLPPELAPPPPTSAERNASLARDYNETLAPTAYDTGVEPWIVVDEDGELEPAEPRGETNRDLGLPNDRLHQRSDARKDSAIDATPPGTGELGPQDGANMWAAPGNAVRNDDDAMYRAF